MRIGLKISDAEHNWQTLSEEIYEIVRNDGTLHDYEGTTYFNGQRVRLISGVMDSHVAGYHTSHGWVTVCRDDAVTAEFCGFKRSRLKLVSE